MAGISMKLLDKTIKAVKGMPSYEIQELATNQYKRQMLAELKRQIDWLLSKVEEGDSNP